MRWRWQRRGRTLRALQVGGVHAGIASCWCCLLLLLSLAVCCSSTPLHSGTPSSSTLHVALPCPHRHHCAADIKYGSLLEVDETLKKLRGAGPKAGEAMLVEEVGPEEIAGVVSKWTGEVTAAPRVTALCGCMHACVAAMRAALHAASCACCLHLAHGKLAAAAAVSCRPWALVVARHPRLQAAAD